MTHNIAHSPIQPQEGNIVCYWCCIEYRAVLCVICVICVICVYLRRWGCIEYWEILFVICVICVIEVALNVGLYCVSLRWELDRVEAHLFIFHSFLFIFKHTSYVPIHILFILYSYASIQILFIFCSYSIHILFICTYSYSIHILFTWAIMCVIEVARLEERNVLLFISTHVFLDRILGSFDRIEDSFDRF